MSNGLPEITEKIIGERINQARVGKVPEENAAAEPISYTKTIKEDLLFDAEARYARKDVIHTPLRA